ncbi:hypothetical protein G7046_g7137 [Stylonectria norvegica]|nr:hypothetical protein G7046_g7137 [Stylonectria norvegica]
MPTFGQFMHTQFVLKIPQPTASFASKTVIVTGANGGFGKEVVKHIVRLGANKAICACRNISNGERVKREIEAASQCDGKTIEIWQLDLESPSSIKSFVDCAITLPRLDVLINVAGIMCVNHSVVYDTERSITMKTISTFLFAVQMIPKLKETAQQYGTTPHMTFVKSALYDSVQYPKNPGNDVFAFCKDKKQFRPQNMYNLSKLFQIYATIRLSALVEPVVINSVDPCFSNTGLGIANANIDGLKLLLIKIGFGAFQAIFARSAEEGSRLIVQATAAGNESHGGYMRAGALEEYAPITLDEDKATAVWEQLCQRLEKLQPGVLKSLDQRP